MRANSLEVLDLFGWNQSDNEEEMTLKNPHFGVKELEVRTLTFTPAPGGPCLS